jgi:serine phosphatase RsbU (regulator of sigma subunit)
MMDPGDTLVVFTDGLTGGRRGRPEIGRERVGVLLDPGLGARALCNLLDTAAADWSGGAHDDTTIIVLRLKR